MKKIIDERGRVFGVISIIDVIAIAVIAVLLTAVIVRRTGNESSSPLVNTVPVTYTVKIYNVRDTTTKIIRTDDKLYTQSGIYIGTITDIATESATLTSLLNDGTYTSAISEERYDMTLTVKTDCSEAGGRYYADRTYELCANTEQRIRTKYVDTSGTIMTVTVD